MKKRLILSIDGGGVRGIIPARILAEIEKITGKATSELFDIVAGTSTGAIVAAGLCLRGGENGPLPRFKAEHLVHLFLNNGSDIFHQGPVRKATSFFSLPKHNEKPLEKVLHRYFREYYFSDTVARLLITTYDLAHIQPKFFRSWDESAKMVKMKCALRAATAMPTYFTPKTMVDEGLERTLIDGGIFASNPAACAYAEGLTLFPNDDIHVFSIGTGFHSEVKENQRYVGLLPSAQTLVEAAIQASKEVVNYQLKRVLKEKFIRIEPQPSNAASDEIAESSPENILILSDVAEKETARNKDKIDSFLGLYDKP